MRSIHDISDPWHYPRPALAAAYLGHFQLGLSAAKGLFAQRRMGKTEFLKQDLIPAAHHAGYLTAYVNLWDNRADPATVLVEALLRAIEAKGLEKLLRSLNPSVKKLRASGKLAGVGEGSVEAELASEQKFPGSVFTEGLREFDKHRKLLLLVIDEAQVLASPVHANFAHSLRAALDVRKDRIKVIFAGSSEATLRRMFAKASEPFYNWAALEPFDLLGCDFVDHMVRRINAISKYPLAPADALEAFEALNRTPEFFRRYLEHYLAHPAEGSDAALAHCRAHIFNDANFVNQWTRLLPADQEILRMLAQGTQDLHSKAARERLGMALGLDKASELNTPQQALRRLQADNLLTRVDHGKYRFEDEAFAEWVRIQDQ